MGSKLIPVSQEPRLLKDFLKENSQSFSSINFQHKKPFFDDQNLNATLFSNKALSKFFVKAIKYLPFPSIKSPSILPRSISRRLSSNNTRMNNLHGNVDVKEISVKVKVKDILRWRSFRDLADEQSPPLDFSSSPHHCTTVTTTTGSSSSSRSSWCDSDFSAEDLPLWCSEEEGYAGETEVQKGKKLLSLGGVGRESMIVQPKVEWPCEEEKEQNSPVSVLDFSFQEDEESFSFFHQTPTNLKPKKMQRKGLFTSNNSMISTKEETNGALELKAMQLLNLAKGTSFVESYEDLLLLDFFREELSTSIEQKGDAFDCELLRVAKAWINGEDDGCLEWKMVGKREFSVRDMERGVRWNKFEDDEQELSLEMENLLLNYLVDELLLDFLNH